MHYSVLMPVNNTHNAILHIKAWTIRNILIFIYRNHINNTTRYALYRILRIRWPKVANSAETWRMAELENINTQIRRRFGRKSEKYLFF